MRGGARAVSTMPGAAATPNRNEASRHPPVVTDVHICQFLTGAKTYGNNL